MLKFGFVRSHEILCYLASSSGEPPALSLRVSALLFSSFGCDDFVSVSVLGGPVDHCPVSIQVISLVFLDLGGSMLQLLLLQCCSQSSYV